MSDAMTEEMIKQLYWEEGEEALWTKCKEDFLKKPESARLRDLHIVGQWLDQESDRPTKELASLLTKKREMEDLHLLLKGANR
jgi:hypothetical protein